MKVDWYHYGGITRELTVEQLNGSCILNNRMEYTLSADRSTANCRFVLELYNIAGEETTSQVTAQLDGATVYSAPATLAAHSGAEITTPDFTVENVRLWDVDQPNLYQIRLTTDTDDPLYRTGLRTVEVVGQSLCLNGKPLELRGVNRHEDHPDWGMAFRERRKELGLEHKPVIYSEFGGAAIYGHHTFDDLWGAEEYQAELLDKCLHAFHADPMVAGFYIWQFCDMRTCRQMGLDRARSYNNKGILNEYRKPKMAPITS